MMQIIRTLRRRFTARAAVTSAARREDGFGLVESLMSIGIAATGLMAVAGLMATSASLQMRSRDTGRTGMAAVQQLERLRILPSTDPRVQIGGNLNANINNYTNVINVAPTGLVRVRWVVAQGPAGSLDITVRAIPQLANARTSEVRNLVWRPQ